MPDLVPASSALVLDKGIDAAVQTIKQRADTILHVMAKVLEEGKDYGKIPGTDKPTLFKPGAEKLCLTFQLAAVRPTVDDLSTLDEIRYRVSVPIEAANGTVIAVGVGECSSNEEKYRWRRPVVDEEWEDTPEDRRREKWFRGGSNSANWKAKQVRTSPADVANTILKMAHKRAFIHATLLATGASSVFNQDLEDFNKELQEVMTDGGGDGQPQVRRASESRAAPSSSSSSSPSRSGGNPGAFATTPRKVKNVRVVTKNNITNYWLTLDGDPNEYSTRDGKIGLELEQFKGTDHLVVITYDDNVSGGKTYHNIRTLKIADAVGPATTPATTDPATASAATPEPTTGEPLRAGDIPFGR